MPKYLREKHTSMLTQRLQVEYLDLNVRMTLSFTNEAIMKTLFTKALLIRKGNTIRYQYPIIITQRGNKII